MPKSRLSHTNIKFKITNHANFSAIEPIIQKRAGDSASKKLKVVCKQCNETWMSRIEELAKEALTPLLLGSVTNICPEEQLSIVNWIALKTIVGEFDDEADTRVIDEGARKAFFERRELRGIWKIWLGYYDGEGAWQTRYRHCPALLFDKNGPVDYASPPNSQVTTFVGGRLFIHVLHSRFALTQSYGFKGVTGEMLRVIYPSPYKTISWPPTRRLKDEDADFVADALYYWPRAHQQAQK